MRAIDELNKLLEDLEFPPVTIMSEPNIPETDRIELYDSNDSNNDNENDPKSKNHYTEEELDLYKQIIIINNNYISSIQGMIDQLNQDGWSEKKISELLGLANAYRDDLYKFGNDNQNKVSQLPEDAKNLIYGEYWSGLKACRNYYNFIASVVIDPEVNTNEEVVGNKEKSLKSMSKEDLLNNLEKGKVPFTPTSKISDKAQKKLNNILVSMQNQAEQEKLTLGKSLLGLQVTQDLIKAAAYTNPLTAVAYELYQNVFKPISKLQKDLAKEKIKNYETLKSILDAYFKQNGITLKDLDKYITKRKDNKNKPLQDRTAKIGKTDYFLMEQYFKSKKVTQKYGKAIGLEELEIYLLDASGDDQGEENETRQEQVRDTINRLRSNNDIKVKELIAYRDAWDKLSDKEGKRPAEIEVDSNLQATIGDVTVKDFSKHLTTDKTLSNPDKLITFEEFETYINDIKETEIGDEGKSLKRKKVKREKKDKLDNFKKKNKISDDDINSYITDRKKNDNKFIGKDNPQRKVGNATIDDFENFLLDNEIQDLKLLSDINKGENMDETLQMGQRFPLTYLTGKKKSDFKDNQEIINYIQDKTDYTVIKDNGDELEVADVTKPDRPVDVISLNECMLCDVEEIGDGIVVFMPSGFEAELTIEDDTVNVDYYTHNDTYSVDEFGKIIKDGILKFNEPSSIMESNHAGVTLNGKDNIKIDFDTRQAVVYITINDELTYKIDEDIFMNNISDYVYNLIDKDEREFTLNWDEHFRKLNRFLHKVNEDFDYKPYLSKHAETINKLDKIQKKLPTRSKEKQSAITLMDATGLGVDVKKEADELEKKTEKMNELSDKLVNKVSQERLNNFVNAETEEERKENYKKLRKNIILNKNRKKEQMSELSEAIDELNKVLEDVEINEISDEPVYDSHAKRFHNMNQAKSIEKAKYGKYKNLRDRVENFNLEKEEIEDQNKNIQDLETAQKEWEEAQQELEIAGKKFEKNVNHLVNREFRKDNTEEKDESLNEDIGGLTDVADLDLPQPLADTIEVTDEGTVLTLDSLYSEIKALKSELTSAVQSIKDNIENLKNEVKENQEVEVLQNIDNKVDELTTEMANQEELPEEPVENDNEETPEENTEEENAEEENAEEENAEEENAEEGLEESYSKFKKKGVIESIRKAKQNEDMNKIKQQVDKAIQNGKDADAIQNTIDLNAKDEKEKEEGREYAADKMSEEKVNKIMDKISNSRNTSALNNIRYHK